MTDPQYEYDEPSNVDNITINVGGTWVFSQYYHNFIAPYTGIYYFAVGVGASPLLSMGISLQIFPASKVRRLYLFLYLEKVFRAGLNVMRAETT